MYLTHTHTQTWSFDYAIIDVPRGPKSGIGQPVKYRGCMAWTADAYEVNVAPDNFKRPSGCCSHFTSRAQSPRARRRAGALNFKVMRLSSHIDDVT